MKKALLLGVLLLAGCSHNPKPQPPQPPPPEPGCEVGQTTCCWHQPPGNQWLYACPAPELPGGVLNVAGGPDQCPGKKCSGTTPEEPPPTGGSGPVPPVGTPIGDGGKLLRNQNNQHFRLNSGERFDPFMAVPCCEGWAKVPNQRWPMASEGFMDETGKYGANMFHFRIGPWYGDESHESEWKDIGGAYNPDGSWNAKFWQKVRSLVWHAWQKGAYVEVAPIDTWYVKHCQWGDQQCPWPADDVKAAYDGVRSPHQENLIRKTVAETCDFDNVVYVTGNEEDEVPAGGELYQWYIETIRSEEGNCPGKKVHMIGTGSTKSGIGADYSVTHSKHAVTGPCNGRLCVNNEHNPEFPPDQEASYFAQARAAGQVWAAWRAGAKDEAWEERLRLFQDVVKGEAGPVGCYAPDSEDPAWVEPPISPDARGPQMMAAVNEAKARVGNRCGATAPCTSEPCAPPVHLGCLETNGLVAAELRKMGHCASGPWVDATVVKAPDGIWEEYHICSTGDGCYTGHPYKWGWKYAGSSPTPPSQSGCSDPVPPPLYTFALKLEGTGWWNGTPIVKDHSYCESIGMGTMPDGSTPRNECPVRNECPGFKCQERAACERVVMGGLATWRSNGETIVDETNENHLLAKCKNCSWIEVCNTVGQLCRRGEVQ